MTVDAPRSKHTGVPGWLTDNEELLLRQEASRLRKGAVVVNIGVEYGRSMSVFAKFAGIERTIIGVEIKPKPEFDMYMAEAGLSGRYKIVVGDSRDIASVWETPVDLLFIDGGHDYKSVKADIEGWIKHVVTGGRVVFHDVACSTNEQPHPLHWEVSRAVNEWFSEYAEDWQITDMADSMMIFKRRV